jgi:hypothetical protein
MMNWSKFEDLLKMPKHDQPTSDPPSKETSSDKLQKIFKSIRSGNLSDAGDLVKSLVSFQLGVDQDPGVSE